MSNDNGKTVTKIYKIHPAYKSSVKKKERWIELNLRLELNPDYPTGRGYIPTLRAIEEVTNRSVRALASEFLPD